MTLSLLLQHVTKEMRTYTISAMVDKIPGTQSSNAIGTGNGGSRVEQNASPCWRIIVGESVDLKRSTTAAEIRDN